MIFLRALSVGSTALYNGVFNFGGTRNFCRATKVFQDMVGQNQPILARIAQGNILGFHRTSATNAIELVRSQQFVGRRGGIHVGKNPEQNGEFGPCVLMVIADKPAEVAHRVFNQDNIKIESLEKVVFRPFRYDQELEVNMRSQPDYEAYEKGDFD